MTDLTLVADGDTILWPSAASASLPLREPGIRPTVRTEITETKARPAVVARERSYRRTLALSDALAVSLTLLLHELLGAGQDEATVLLLIPAVLLGAKLTGLYDRDALVVRKTTLDDAPGLLVLAMMFILVTWFGQDLLLQDRLARPDALGMLVFLFLAMLVGRWSARAIIRRVLRPERCLLIGEQPAQDRLQNLMQANPHASLVCRVTMADALIDGQDDTAALDTLRFIADEFELDRVIVEPSADTTATYAVIRGAKHLGLRVSILPGILDVVGCSVAIDDLRGLTLLGLHRFGLSRSSAALKRAMDVISAAAVLVLSAPVLAVIAVAIRIDSPGPILFRQYRVGRHGRRFEILKFRSMVADADSLKGNLTHLNQRDGLFKVDADPRVTRVGRVLRATSLDELPQLINVLRGEMSLVGPRPLIHDEDDRVVGWDRRRLALTPGMTGPWQITPASHVSLGDMVKIDYGYVATWTLWQDCKILLRTVPHMLARRST